LPRAGQRRSQRFQRRSANTISYLSIPMNDDARQLLRSLLDPRIAKFVDWRKFLHSSEFELIAKSQVDHFIKHGDSTRIKLLLDAFGGSKS
jgi:hypothetical protein